MAETHYDVLGVGSDATSSQIKKAYFRLAKERHPDKNPDDPKAKENFQRLSDAYTILMDEDKRRSYDALLPTLQLLREEDVEPHVIFDNASALIKRNGMRKGDFFVAESQSSPGQVFLYLKTEEVHDPYAGVERHRITVDGGIDGKPGVMRLDGGDGNPIIVPNPEELSSFIQQQFFAPAQQERVIPVKDNNAAQKQRREAEFRRQQAEAEQAAQHAHSQSHSQPVWYQADSVAVSTYMQQTAFQGCDITPVPNTGYLKVMYLDANNQEQKDYYYARQDASGNVALDYCTKSQDGKLIIDDRFANKSIQEVRQYYQDNQIHLKPSIVDMGEKAQQAAEQQAARDRERARAEEMERKRQEQQRERQEEQSRKAAEERQRELELQRQQEMARAQQDQAAAIQHLANIGITVLNEAPTAGQLEGGKVYAYPYKGRDGVLPCVFDLVSQQDIPNDCRRVSINPVNGNAHVVSGHPINVGSMHVNSNPINDFEHIAVSAWQQLMQQQQPAKRSAGISTAALHQQFGSSAENVRAQQQHHARQASSHGLTQEQETLLTTKLPKDLKTTEEREKYNAAAAEIALQIGEARIANPRKNIDHLEQVLIHLIHSHKSGNDRGQFIAAVQAKTGPIGNFINQENDFYDKIPKQQKWGISRKPSIDQITHALGVAKNSNELVSQMPVSGKQADTSSKVPAKPGAQDGIHYGKLGVEVGPGGHVNDGTEFGKTPKR